MASLNKVYLLGNLTRDPDLRGLPSGQSVCELRLAVSRHYINSNGQDAEDTCFVDVVVWGKSANNCRNYLAKGSQVLVEGRLQLDQWEDRNGGGQRSRLRVVAEQIQFMNRKRDDGEHGGNSNNMPYDGGNNYSAPRGGNYGGGYPPPPPPRQGDGGYRPPMSSDYRRPQDTPPMPEPDAPGTSLPPEDDIPF